MTFKNPSKIIVCTDRCQFVLANRKGLRLAPILQDTTAAGTRPLVTERSSSAWWPFLF